MLNDSNHRFYDHKLLATLTQVDARERMRRDEIFEKHYRASESEKSEVQYLRQCLGINHLDFFAHMISSLSYRDFSASVLTNSRFEPSPIVLFCFRVLLDNRPAHLIMMTHGFLVAFPRRTKKKNTNLSNWAILKRAVLGKASHTRKHKCVFAALYTDVFCVRASKEDQAALCWNVDIPGEGTLQFHALVRSRYKLWLALWRIVLKKNYEYNLLNPWEPGEKKCGGLTESEWEDSRLEFLANSVDDMDSKYSSGRETSGSTTATNKTTLSEEMRRSRNEALYVLAENPYEKAVEIVFSEESHQAYLTESQLFEQLWHESFETSMHHYEDEASVPSWKMRTGRIVQ